MSGWRGLGRLRTALIGVVLVAALAAGADAQAQSPGNPVGAEPPTNPLVPGLPSSPTQQTTTTAPTPTVRTTPTSGASNGLSGTGALAIGLGALVLLGGIAVFIWRDARRRAPARRRAAAGPVVADEAGRPGSKQRPKPRKLSPAERRRRKRGRAR